MSTAGQPIDCLAAVAWAPNEPLAVETITVAPPKANEVRIKMFASSICHTDLYTLGGKDPEGVFPVVLGHEGAGIVESVGANVATVRPGDHVLPLYIPQCGGCEFCLSAKTNLCSRIRDTQGRGLMPDGTVRFSCRSKPLFHFMGCSTFSQYTVVADISVAKINNKAPMDRVCLLGCGIPTGYGAALNTANVEKASKVAVWGAGCVGNAVILGAVKCGASMIVAIDKNDHRLCLAKEFGATHTVKVEGSMASLQQRLLDISDGGFDYTFECIGNTDTMRMALECCHKGWGVSVIIGVAAAGQEIHTRPFYLVTGRTWKGCAFGGFKSRDSVPLLVEQYMNGQLEVDKFVNGEYSLMAINEAISDTRSGLSLRTIVKL